LKPRAAEYSGAGPDKMSSPKRRIETDVGVPRFQSLTDSWKKNTADTVAGFIGHEVGANFLSYSGYDTDDAIGCMPLSKAFSSLI
jgi:hypothetical protein